MAKCIERESVANYQFMSLRLINSSACLSKTLNFSHTAKHPFFVMASMQSLLSIAHLSFPRHPFQESDEKASHSASSSSEATEELRQYHVKSRAIKDAGVDNAMPTDSKWNNHLGESNSVSVDASVRIHDDGQSTFLEQVHYVYSVLTKSFCFH